MKRGRIRRSLPYNEHSFSVARATAQHGKRRPNGLSFEARGLLLYLLSKPAEWTITFEDIMAEGGIGRDKTRRLLNELRAARYVVTEPVQDETGQFTGVQHTVYAVPNGMTENPSVGISAHDDDMEGDGETDFQGDGQESSNGTTEKPSDGSTGLRENRRIKNRENTQNRETTPPASAGKYPTYAEQHPDLFDAELEDTKRAAVADLVADGAKRYINNTLKDQLERTVAHIFQTGGGEARVIARMLRGRPKKDDGQAWHDAAADFIDAEVDSDELLAWAQWYERKNPDTTLPKTPHKLAGSILYWRENAKRESSRTGSEYYGGYKIVG